jgi:AraC family transcriptional activator of pyochelin receptor
VLAEAVFLLTFACDQTGAIISVSAHASPPSRSNADVTISLTLEACQRWFGEKPLEGRWHMSRTLRAIVLAMAQAARRDATSLLYLRGKGLELVCETLSSLSANQLVPCSAGDVLSEADTTRIFRARTIIEDRHAEPLTLHMIALACGVNRSKLTKGFNALFGITVAEFICMTRMSSARELLLTTDLRITTISARCGYSNNASFSRAFLRHYGVSPMTLRARPL